MLEHPASARRACDQPSAIKSVLLSTRWAPSKPRGQKTTRTGQSIKKVHVVFDQKELPCDNPSDRMGAVGVCHA